MLYSMYIKRILDLIVASVCMLLLLPLFAMLALMIKIDSKGPVLFKQKRFGKGKTHFAIFKFRSMQVDAPSDVPTHMIINPNAYVTKLGKFLRKTSFDELPQVINIIKGEMSIVGPRPALWNQFDLIEEREHYKANDIRPGLTGYAQINGRDELKIEDKAKLDGEYVKRMGFFFDVVICLKTVFRVIRRDGVRID